MQDTDIEFRLVPKLDEGALGKVVSSLDSVLASIGGIDLISDESRRQIEEARKGLKGLADSVEPLNNELGEADKKGKSLGDTFTKAFAANQAIDFAKEISGMVSELSQPFVALDTATQQLKTLGAEAAAMAPSLREAAIEMSTELPFAAAEIQTTMFDALASGVKGGEEGLKAFADTAAKLAVGGSSSIGDATNLLAGNLNAYGKSAEDAAKFSDIFFNTINYGVTSAAELSNTLSNVVPTAAAAGIELEGVGAALAVMTSKGIPTAQSTTKLNALLLELQKPAADLAPILKDAGISLESLKNDDLPVSLGKVSDALKRAGKASVEVFSSSEAGAAFATLAGDLEGFTQTFEDVRDTTGSAQNAYEQMAGSVQTQTDQMLSAVNAFVISGLDTVGPAFVTAAQGATQLAPMVTTMAGIGNMLPEGLGKRAADFASGMLQKVVPSIFVTNAATGVASISFSAMWTALTGPVGLAIAGIAAVGIGIALLASQGKSLAEATTDAKDSLDKLGEARGAAEAAEAQTKQLSKLSDEYTKLKDSSDPKEQARFIAVTDQLAKRVPPAADAISDLSGAANKSGAAFAINTDEVRAYAEEMEKIANQNLADALGDMDDQTRSLAETISESREKMAELRAERDAISKGEGQVSFFENPNVALAQWMGIMPAMKGELEGVREEINQMSPELKAATEQQRKQIEGYAEMGFSIDDVAERLGVAKEELLEFAPPDFKSSIVNAKDFQDAISGISDAQQQAVNQVVNFGEQYKKAQADVDELNSKIADAQFGGDKDLEAKLKEDLEKAQKVADEKKLKLSTALDDEQTKETLSKLPEDAKKLMAPITASINFVNDEKALKETQAKAGTILREISELQKSQAAAAGTANEKIYSDKLIGKANEYKANLQSQAEVIATNSQKLDEMKAAKEKATDPVEVKRLSGEIVTMEKTIAASAKQFSNTVDQGKRLGLVKGDIKGVSTELGLSEKAARGTASAAKSIAEESKKAAEAAGDVGAAFEAAQKSSGDMVNKLASTYAANLLRLKGDLDEVTRTRLEEQNAQIRKDALAIQNDLAAGRSAIDQARQQLGFNREKDAKEAEERRKKAEADAEKRRKEAEKERMAQLNYEAQQRATRQANAAAEIDDDYTRTLALIENERRLAQARIDIRKLERGVNLGDIRRDQGTLDLDIEQKRNAAKLEALKKFGVEMIRVRTEITLQDVSDIRAAAALITENDVRSIRQRAALTVEAMRLEAQAKRRQAVESNEQFAVLLKEHTKEQAEIVVQAGKTYADEQAKVNGLIDKLLEENKKKIADQRKKGLPVDATLTEEEARKQLEERGLLVDEKRYGEALRAQRKVLTDMMEGFSNEVVEALNAGNKRTQRQNQLLEQMIPDPAQREKLINTIEIITREVGTAEINENKKNENLLATARLEARLAATTDVGEKDRLQRQLESKKTLDSDLRLLEAAQIALDERRKELADSTTGAVPLSELEELPKEQERIDRAKELAARRHAKRMQDIDIESLRETDDLANAAFVVRELQWSAHFGKVDQLRLDDLEKQKEENSKAQDDLEAQYRRGEINIEAYYSKRNELAKQQDELEKEIANSQFDIVRGLESAAAEAFGKIAEHQKKGLDTTISDFEVGAANYGDIAEDFAVTLAATAAQTGLTLAAQGKEMEDIYAGVGNMAIDMAFSLLEKMAPIWSAQILGLSLATPMSVATLGASAFIEWAALTALMNAAIGVARASIKPFSDGGETGGTDPTRIAGIVHEKEFVLPAPVIDVPENLAVARHLHKGGTLREFAQMNPEIFGIVGNDEPSWHIDGDGVLQAPVDPLGIVEAIKYGNSPDELSRALLSFEMLTEMKQQTGILREIHSELETLRKIESRIGHLESLMSDGNINTALTAAEIGKEGYGNSLARQLRILKEQMEELTTAIKRNDSRRN